MDIIRKHDWVVTIITWVLVIIGIITIYSITYNAENAIRGQGTANKQLIFAFIGLGLYVSISALVDYTYFKNYVVVAVLYLLVIGLLVVVLAISQANRGSVRWIALGPLSLEPSELSKLLVIIVSAFLFRHRLEGKSSLKRIALAVIIIAPILGLVFIQPDLSTTISLLTIALFIFLSSAPDFGKTFATLITVVLAFNMTMLAFNALDFYKLVRLGDFIEQIGELRWCIFILLAGISSFIVILKRRDAKVLFLALLVGAALSIGYSYAWNNVIKDYQKERINTFINPEEDPLGAGYQVNQSIIATGSGHFWGRGFGRGTQSNLNFLPERHTDFIFASYAEEFGFVGTVFLVFMYIGLLIRIVYIGIRSEDNFAFLICIGVATMIFVQFAINVGMNIGLMPVTGITLPLMSYGGSSLLTTIMGIALVQSVAKGRDLIDTNDSLIIRE